LDVCDFDFVFLGEFSGISVTGLTILRPGYVAYLYLLAPSDKEICSE